ncbi:hypothetical protein ABMA28_003602 [Loxostege sticticalis]|uniref:Endonuclease/exonuclease/phosphatase domain-containing protein n=1 Tax=Loxostege sticticalis TaxID=481309 RepID=A0ABD0SWZ1_LOXSC
MALRVLQANINHSTMGQDLLLQHIVEWSIDVAIVSEPYWVPTDRETWIADTAGLVVVITTGALLPVLVARGEGWVAIKLRGMLLVGVYSPSGRRSAELEVALDRMGVVIQQSPLPVLAAGDFHDANAKSTAWGSRLTDVYGDILLEWATVMGLCVCNVGTVATCVRPQGESLVDITFASPAVASRVRDWRVLVLVESGSDHRYVRFDIASANTGTNPNPARSNCPALPRWKVRSLDQDSLKAAALVKTWLPAQSGPVQVDQEAEWLREAMTDVCDAAMPRSRPLPPRRHVYWWSEDIAELRRACIAARRES